MYGHQKQGIMTLEEAQKEVDRWISSLSRNNSSNSNFK